MSRVVKLGFVPLADSAPLVVAEKQGFFADEGLAVELRREVSWATVRDKVALGALDGAHMLAPMALAASIGVGSEPAAILAPMALARGGAAVTLSSRLGGDAGDLARLIARRREQGASPLTFAVVFPYSIHNYLLRAWMAGAGVDPDADVRLTVAPPSRMAELLAEGVIEGFAAGEPWNAAAVRAGVGRLAVRATELWERAPDKILGVGQAFAEGDPPRLQAVLRALLRAAAWTDAASRADLAEMLSRAEHVGVAAEVISDGLAHVVFQRNGASAPQPRDAVWLIEQMQRWRQVSAGIDAARIAARVYRPDLHAEAAGALSA